jgi:hypothetical protein
MSGLNISSILSMIVAVATGLSDAAFAPQIATLFGDKAPAVLAVLVGVALVATKVLSVLDSEKQKAIVAPIVASITPLTSPACLSLVQKTGFVPIIPPLPPQKGA